MDTMVPPVGRHQRLRVLVTETTPTASREVVGIGKVDLIIGRHDCYIDRPETWRFSPRAGGARTGLPPCTPADLAQAVWAPAPPDILVTHDLASQQLTLPASLTGRLPWIGTHRVAVHAGLNGWPYDLEPLVQARGLQSILAALPDEGPQPAVARAAVLTAVLLADLQHDAAVRAVARPFYAEAERCLRPVLGDLLGDPILQGMLHLSTALARPRHHPPGPWDDAEDWAMVPMDDLRWFAASCGSVTDAASARAELDRRVRCGEPVERHVEPPRLLLRRAAR